MFGLLIVNRGAFSTDISYEEGEKDDIKIVARLNLMTDTPHTVLSTNAQNLYTCTMSSMQTTVHVVTTLQAIMRVGGQRKPQIKHM